MNSPIEYLSNQIQQKNYVYPAGAGEVILLLAKSISKLFSLTNITHKNLEQNLIKSCKSLTNAS